MQWKKTSDPFLTLDPSVRVASDLHGVSVYNQATVNFLCLTPAGFDTEAFQTGARRGAGRLRDN